MARSIAQIQTQILADIAADPTLTPVDTSVPGFRSTSKRAIYVLLSYIVAVATSTLENIIDIFKSSVEAINQQSAAASADWIIAKAFAFQYDATTPQVVQMINTVPQYPVVDQTKCIVTQVAVSTDISNNCLIKFAIGSPPGAADSLQIAAIQSYFNTIGGAGISYLLSSGAPDQLYVDATIYFDGQYQVIIQQNVITAITNFLEQLSTTNFGGNVQMSDLENVIRNTTGVKDVVMNNVKARADGTSFSDGIFLIQDTDLISRLWPTVTGYIIPETTSGETLSDSLSFVAV